MILRPFTAASALCVLAFFASGCTSLPFPAFPTTRGDRAEPILVEVRELPAEGRWEVGFALPRPVAGVELAGDAARARSWAVAAAGTSASWVAGAEAERLCFASPTDAFSASFRYRLALAGAEPFVDRPFGADGRVLDTRSLVVRPLAACGDAVEPATGSFAHRFRFVTAPGRSIRAGAGVGDGQLAWEPPPGPEAAASFVAFGDREPTAADGAALLVDPALPASLAGGVRTAFPALASRFAAWTGTTLLESPLVLVVAGPPGAETWTASGNASSLLLVAPAGATEQAPPSDEGWLLPLARAAFPLWGDAAGARDTWLDEAAADHFALTAAREIEGASDLEAAAWLARRANQCLVRLGGEPAAALAAAGDTLGARACGVVAFTVADAALRRAPTPSTAATLFQSLLAQGDRTGEGSGAGPFLGWLQHLGAAPETVGALVALLETGVPHNADALLHRLLGEAGIATQRVSPGSATLAPGTLVALVERTVGRCRCGGDGDLECSPAAEGAGARSVAGIRIADRPLEALARIQAAVARELPLLIEGTGGTETLLCPPDTLDPTFAGLLRVASAGG